MVTYRANVTTLMIYAGPGDAESAVTRTGGIPVVPAGFQWPHCGECGRAMTFLAQIRLAEVDPADDGMFAVFMCGNDDGTCQTWEPFGGANHAYVFPPGPSAPAAVPADGAPLLGAVSAVELTVVDGDEYQAARRQWYERTGRQPGEVLGQLGGRPEWIQAEEVPACPVCGEPMTFVAQLEEGYEHEHSANYGGGTAYAFRCRRDATGAFLWQQ